jgi:hypothetical protein
VQHGDRLLALEHRLVGDDEPLHDVAQPPREELALRRGQPVGRAVELLQERFFESPRLLAVVNEDVRDELARRDPPLGGGDRVGNLDVLDRPDVVGRLVADREARICGAALTAGHERRDDADERRRPDEVRAENAVEVGPDRRADAKRPLRSARDEAPLRSAGTRPAAPRLRHLRDSSLDAAARASLIRCARSS